jgi:hypothetical protein
MKPARTNFRFKSEFKQRIKAAANASGTILERLGGLRLSRPAQAEDRKKPN